MTTKLEARLTSAHGCIYATTPNDVNRRREDGITHNTETSELHRYTASEFMLNNTVRRLVQSQGNKNGYKLVRTCAEGQAKVESERVQIFVDICKSQPMSIAQLPLIKFAEHCLKEFAQRVDGVELERVGRTTHEWCTNPAMRVKG